MRTITGELKDLTIGMDGTQNVTISIHSDFREEYQALRGSVVDVEIKKHRKRRSRDANAFLWAVCQQIGNALQPPIPKEEVYRRAIRDVGVHEPLPIREQAVESFCHRWSEKGIGWFADVIDDSKLPGYKLVFAYYGSSTYDSKEMSVLIDYIVDEARQMGLQILTRSEIDLLKSEWAMERTA